MKQSAVHAAVKHSNAGSGQFFVANAKRCSLQRKNGYISQITMQAAFAPHAWRR